MLRAKAIGSLIFWGPPGSGKTTVARLLAQETTFTFVQISAIFTGVAELKRFRGGAGPPRGGPGHIAVRRRDPPL